jgi:hypothetical protein
VRALRLIRQADRDERLTNFVRGTLSGCALDHGGYDQAEEIRHESDRPDFDD